MKEVKGIIEKKYGSKTQQMQENNVKSRDKDAKQERMTETERKTKK